MTSQLLETKLRFRSSLEVIAKDLIKCFDLKFSQDISNLSDPMNRWIDFRLRYIDPKPRAILASNKFPKRFPDTVEPGFLALQNAIIQGKDINAYQSKGLINYNDISGAKRSTRTDLPRADWGISHLHITDKPLIAGYSFSPRNCSDGESWLLFCIFGNDYVLLVDIKNHSELELFSDQSMLETVYQSWPAYMDQFELKGILPCSIEARHTNQAIQKFRSNGLAASCTIDGKSFMDQAEVSQPHRLH